MENISVLGIDLSKNVFQVHGVNHCGRCVARKRLRREGLLAYMSTLPRGCTIAMEACGASHYWAREFCALGFEIKLIAPQHVKPFVKSQKNDRNDAEAICEAAQRPTMRFVGIKTRQQQDLQCLHRAREGIMTARVALINQIRGFLQEFGIVMPKGASAFKSGLRMVLTECGERLSGEMQFVLTELQSELCALETKLTTFEHKLEVIARTNPVAHKLTKVPGVGTITATALITIATPQTFKNGRNFAAWLGLVPRQYSSGGKVQLGHITKGGDTYIRTLLIHGARSAIRCCGQKSDRTSLWVKSLQDKRGTNRAAVALANKNARMLWVLLTSQSQYKPQSIAA